MLRNYVKIALKVLLRRRFFTAISLFCISFTLVVLMVVAALLDHMLSPVPPEVHAGRTLLCNHLEMVGEQSQYHGEPGYLFLDRYVRPLPGAEAVTVFSEHRSAVTFVGERKIVSQVRYTDGTYWRILRYRFLEGGPFDDADDRDGNAVAIVNAATRQRVFGDGVEAVGRNIELDGQTFRIIGVVDNVPVYRRTAYADVWAPIGSLRSDQYRSELVGGFHAAVLAKNRSDMRRLKDEFASVLPRVEMTQPETYKEMRGTLLTPVEAWAGSMVPGRTEAAKSRLGDFILLLTAVSLLFMSLPAMNLVNLNLSRILERSSEIGVRKAFGASSRTLVGQFVLENVLLCLIGGLVAWAGSWAMLRVIEATGWIPYAHLSLNIRLFAVALGLAAFFGVLSGVYPAWRMSRLHPVLALRGGVS